MSKAQKIEALLKEGMRPGEVAKRLKVSRQYVYGINSKLRRKQRAIEPKPLTFWQKVKRFFTGE